MYLSRLDVHGFKSFATPTVFQFDPGITAIVGPNGCGKSNVVDAIRWVIGEQRARILRSDKMDSVIFNGTARRRGLGMAEVQLTVQNTRGLLPTEFSEVTLGRRLYRSGDSEYLLNGTSCRLRDIVDLFLDTGMGAGAYSVIELKMVEEILSESTQDRRRLFEEAAGITKYKLRRAQALRKLDNLQVDLARVQDLTQEVARRVARLDRQAEAAARHNTLGGRAQTLALALATLQYNRLASEVSALEEHLARVRDTLAHLKAESGSHEAVLQGRKQTHIDNEKGTVRCERSLAEHQTRIGYLSAELRLREERRAAEQRDIARARQERKEALARRANREAALLVLRDEHRSAEPRLKNAANVLEPAKNARDMARQNVAAKRSSLSELSSKQAKLVIARAGHLRRFDQITNRIELAKAEGSRLQAEAERLDRALVDEQARAGAVHMSRIAAEAALQQAQQAEAEAAEEHHALQGQIVAADKTARVLAEQQAAKQAEASLLEALVTGYEDFPEATRFLAGAEGELLTISDVLETSSAHRAALGAALGSLGACIVVQTVDEAHRKVALLRDEKKGRGLFVVMERIPQEIVPMVPREGMTPLMDLVSVTDRAYEPLARLVLRDIYYADDLDALVPVPGHSPARLVTATGEWVDEHGFLHAGSQTLEASAQHMVRRARLASTQVALEALRRKHLDQKEALATLRQQQDAVALAAHRETLSDARHALAAAKREEARQNRNVEALEVRQAKLSDRIQEAAQAANAMADEAVEPRSAAADANNRLTALEALIAASKHAQVAAYAECNACEDRFAAARLAHQDARNTLDRLRRGIARVGDERTAAAERAEALASETSDLKAAIGSLSKDIGALEAELTAERNRRGPLDVAVREAKTRLMENRVAIDELEQTLRKLRRAHDEMVREKSEYAVQRASLSAKMEELAANAHEKFGASLGSEFILEGEDEASLRAELEKVQVRLRGMGSVNPLALEEYKKERERHTFLVTQCEDLQRAEATLLQTIEEINRTAAKRFKEAFAVIRENFCKLFCELFGGGTSGDLHLVETSDLLESPIAITAQPRGKRPIGISQLSSGEKTLTAIALLFAIYQVKPSPFCFLDEVDAPLDEANIERFMRLIRRFSLDTQFVLVTHNKRTMEMADRLYGITMQEEGVSRLVGVRFEEAMAMAG